MNTKSLFMTPLWIGLLFCLLLSKPTIAQPQQNLETLPDIKTDSAVDERLFLLRLLELHYESWPNDVSDSDEFESEVRDLRKSALRIRQHIIDKELGDNLASLYADYVSSLESYTQFLADIGAIKQSAVEQLQKDSFNSGFKSSASGVTTYGAMRESGYSKENAVEGGIAVAIISLIWDTYINNKEQTRAEQDAIKKAARKVDDKIQSSIGRAKNVAGELTQKYGWSRFEAWFDLSEEQSLAIQSMAQEDKFNELLQLSNDQVNHRPRDPFIRNDRNLYRVLTHENNPSIIVQCARDSYQAAFLVPESSVYDEYRLQLVVRAAHFALEARSEEIRQGVLPYDSTATSRYAVLLWRKVLELTPDDTGEFREELAWSLMSDNQLAEAYKYANMVVDKFKNDTHFAYNYACLMSRTKNAQSALDWLDHAIRIGFWDIAWVRIDPDLQYLRVAKQKEYSKITTPSWEWYVTDDWIWDDIIVTNKSVFPLTNVIINVSLMKDGKKTLLKLKEKSISPGETKKWIDVVEGATDQWDPSSTATLTCDQSK